MRITTITIVGILLSLSSTYASVGDNLPEFKHCCSACHSLVCGGSPQNSLGRVEYTVDQFVNNYQVHFPFKQLFLWDCDSDCDYKCQQIITNERIDHGSPIVKFYGKWPFLRFFGITELASVVFSLLNFYVNYKNFKLIQEYHDENVNFPLIQSMSRQYMYLLVISMMGWVFSTIFHIRDFAITETLDYFGASLIILFNCYVIVIRVFQGFNSQKKLTWFKWGFAGIYGLHVIKLSLNWDYDYNLKFHLLIFLITAGLWVYHSLHVNRLYQSNYYHIQSSNMNLLPLETSIVSKFDFIKQLNFSANWIPLLPIFFNIWLIMSVSFEVFDGILFRLIDCHAIWHLLTVFPQILWYEWNVWDLELYKSLHYKLS